MTEFFLAHVQLQLQENQQSLLIYDSLLSLFPNNNYLKSQKATCLYHLREFDEAESIFDVLSKGDPYSLDHMDIYSNILYVKEERSKLSLLAHHATRTNKFCPQTCCIIGNTAMVRLSYRYAYQS